MYSGYSTPGSASFADTYSFIDEYPTVTPVLALAAFAYLISLSMLSNHCSACSY